MRLLGGLFSDFSEGLEPALATQAPVRASYHSNLVYLPNLSVREEELGTGDGRLFPAALSVLGDGI